MGEPRGAKILLLDIETAPSRVFTWGLFNQNISISQIEEPGYTLCWAAKWLGKKKMMFSSVRKHGRTVMLNKIYALLEEADIVVHYNGSHFDIPTLNREFVKEEMTPPAPFQEVDLLKTCRKRFRFLSNKLDYVIRFLGELFDPPPIAFQRRMARLQELDPLLIAFDRGLELQPALFQLADDGFEPR